MQEVEISMCTPDTQLQLQSLIDTWRTSASNHIDTVVVGQ